MTHRKDLHLARRLQEAIGNEEMEDVFAAALTVCTSAACKRMRVSPLRYPGPVRRYKDAFIGLMLLLVQDIEAEQAAESAPN